MKTLLLAMLNSLIFGYFLGSIIHSETISLIQCIGLLSTGSFVVLIITKIDKTIKFRKSEYSNKSIVRRND